LTFSDRHPDFLQALERARNFAPPAPARQLYCNRTLNLRSIKAVGYDMDYTLVHYHHLEWEATAYQHLQQRLVAMHWPVADLQFDPNRVMRGLVMDKKLGNVVKANRFGYIKQASHGTRQIEVEELRKAYGRTLVDLADTGRWALLNTLFEISEGCMYLQLVDLLDERKLPEVLGYSDLYAKVRHTLDRAHLEGELKAEIVANPARYVDLDPDLPQALLDQQESGKKLLLVTNSEWQYTRDMMAWSFDRFLPAGKTWRDLFAYVIVSSRKPAFFTTQSPLFEVVDEAEGLLRPVTGNLQEGRVYLGGSADRLEKSLGLDGEQILYVGDHMLSDVHQSKKLQQWRTAAIVRELEDEIAALEPGRDIQRRVDALMVHKEALEFAFSQLRLQRQRIRLHANTDQTGAEQSAEARELAEAMNDLREQLVGLDSAIAPLAAQTAHLHNPIWGLMLRTGKDKSLYARQIESHADVYTSRVSNFGPATPFVFLRSQRGDLPHDRD
jgi:5'-nucleotidase